MRVQGPVAFLSLGFSLALCSGCPGDDSPPSGDTGNTSTGANTDSTTGDPPGTTTDPGTSSGDPGTSSGDPGTGSSSDGADSSGSSGSMGQLPDIDMTVVLDQTIQSVYTDTQTFAANACEVQDMCVLGSGERRLLRFDTITPNLGDADFYVGNPTNNPDVFDVDCTGQSVYLNYARYRLLNADGTVEVSMGHKAAFALIDVAPWTDDAGPAQYGFGEDMGISVGWVDIYGAGLPCQYVDITGIASGDYQLEISINAEEEIEEATFDNNILLVPVTITDEDVGPGGNAPKGWTCDPNYYGTFDGCDCGCGVIDPDCADATGASCEFCDGKGACGMSCADIDPADNSQCV